MAQRGIGEWNERDRAPVLLRGLAVINVHEEEIPDQPGDAGNDQQHTRKSLAGPSKAAQSKPEHWQQPERVLRQLMSELIHHSIRRDAVELVIYRRQTSDNTGIRALTAAPMRLQVLVSYKFLRSFALLSGAIFPGKCRAGYKSLGAACGRLDIAIARGQWFPRRTLPPGRRIASMPGSGDARSIS